MENTARIARDAIESRLSEGEAERLFEEERARRQGDRQHQEQGSPGSSGGRSSAPSGSNGFQSQPEPSGTEEVDWEERWASFEANVALAAPMASLISIIPFPPVEGIRRQANRAAAPRKLYRKLALRWHPDKFLQRFSPALKRVPVERGAIMARVTQTFQAVAELNG